MKLTGGQAGVQALREQGVDTVFGIISIHMMNFCDALYDHRDAIRFISSRHEHAAAHMADGYARASGKPGVVFTSSGPGAGNSLTGMGEAYFASSPVLNMTSTAEEELYGRGLGMTHDTRDQLGMFAPVTQWNVHAQRAEEIPDHIAEAFRLFQVRRPRPIEIEVATDVQAKVVDVEIPPARRYAVPQGDPMPIQQAVQLLLTGRRVGIMAGGGIHSSGATRELVRLAESLGVPVITSSAGKGAIPADHALCLGPFGRSFSPKPSPLAAFLDSLDTVLVVASSLALPRTKAQGLKLPENLIHVDIDAESIGKLYEPMVAVVGDAAAVLKQMADGVAGKTPRLQAGYDREIQVLRQAISRYNWETLPNPMRSMAAIRQVMARDAIVVGDVTQPFRRADVCLDVYEPRTYLGPMWGGLGFGLPAAVGAKVGMPQRQVVCITGDGGFQFNMQEVGTCVQYGIAPVVLIFNDNAWGVLRDRQRTIHNGRFIGTDLKNPDFMKLADAYGANGARVQTVAQLEKALGDALASKVISLIEVEMPKGFGELR